MTSLIACAPLARPTQVRTILDAAPSEAKFHSACKCSPRRALLSPQVRTILDAAPSEAKFHSAPLVLQFSSLSSPGTKPEWLVELVRSFCGTRPTPSAIEVVFPTQAQVGESLEGCYACEVHASAHHGALLSPQVRAQRRLRSRSSSRRRRRWARVWKAGTRATASRVRYRMSSGCR